MPSMTARGGALAGLLLFLVAFCPASGALGATAAEIDAEVETALERFQNEVPAGRALLDDAKAALVFPSIVKAGFGIGGQYGEGALRQGGQSVGYYNIVSASFGLQIGAQAYGLIILFMTEDALDYLDQSEGFELGVDAGVTLIETGAAGDLSTSTVQNPIVAFAFGAKGLMAGVTIEGSKITQLDK